VRRISVVGPSGSGKSWIASRVASTLSLPYLELDALRHQPGWGEMPDAQFLDLVCRFVKQDGWVVDGNYFSVVTEPAVWPAADTVIWIDLPKAAVMRQVIWRTLKRGALREELWNGNRESLRNVLRWDPYKSIIRWSWTSHGAVRERYEAAMADERWQYLEFIRLRSQDEVRRFLDSLHQPVGED
jgi:adenylate kinase family enzyme